MAAADLTPEQLAAVEHFEGPLLVLAGPGSGKTRVITRRIARLIERGVSPREILAITFTNKAAREMSDRVAALLPGQWVWVSTFHKFCARLLREYGAAVGLQRNFTIFDTSDQHQLLKQVLHDCDIDAAHFPPAKIGWHISEAKNELIPSDQYVRLFDERIGHHLQGVVARVYPKYQQRLLEANAVDFDDLLMHVAGLLADHEDLRAELDRRFQFILVDEYQDTNRAQYQIVAALSQRAPNLCATGDPDQSIYGWRGARIENILRFERDFPQVTVVRLEQNFRSTPQILAVADSLIAHNRRRKAKILKASLSAGAEVELRQYANGHREADGIAAEIRELVSQRQYRWSDFAIFYRVNALSRSLETALGRARVPYQVAGGVAFYERSEVKDVLAYLRLIENPRDRIAFLRAVNTPPRGIGKQSLSRFLQSVDEQGTQLLPAAQQAHPMKGISRRAAAGLQQFAALIDDLSQHADTQVSKPIAQILARTGYGHVDELHLANEQELQRRSNIDELVSAARLYDEQAGPDGSLAGFLESATLAQDLDAVDTDLGAVTLMTLHSAKGLEFPCVYIVGVEQNLLPHERCLRTNDPQEIEEERRLLFVGITRAEQRLVLTHTYRREMHGRELSTIPSDFLPEMGLTTRDFSHEVFEEAGIEVPRPDSPAPQSATIERLRKLPLLTTGAALESGVPDAVAIPFGFSVGMTVRHPRYGIGTVVEVSAGFSRRRTLTVEFRDEARRETFIAEKCPLQPVGAS